VGRDLLQHDDETGLWARFVQRVGHAVVKRIEVFAEMRWQCELRTNQIQHILLALGFCQIGIQKVMSQTLGGFLQIAHAVSANRLHDI
jgi:hypothetical protein